MSFHINNRLIISDRKDLSSIKFDWVYLIHLCYNHFNYKEGNNKIQSRKIYYYSNEE